MIFYHILSNFDCKQFVMFQNVCDQVEYNILDNDIVEWVNKKSDEKSISPSKDNKLPSRLTELPNLNDTVYTILGDSGIVKYIGTIENFNNNNNQTMIGIICNNYNPNGFRNGEFKNKDYFTCNDMSKCCLFVTLSELITSSLNLSSLDINAPAVNVNDNTIVKSDAKYSSPSKLEKIKFNIIII